MKFSGSIGIRQEAVETSPGIFEQEILEQEIVGTMDTRPLRWRAAELSQDTAKANHVLRTVAPEESLPTMMNVVYVVWHGRKWTVTGIEYNHPSLELTLGGFYNG